MCLQNLIIYYRTTSALLKLASKHVEVWSLNQFSILTCLINCTRLLMRMRWNLYNFYLIWMFLLIVGLIWTSFFLNIHLLIKIRIWILVSKCWRLLLVWHHYWSFLLSWVFLLRFFMKNIRWRTVLLIASSYSFSIFSKWFNSSHVGNLVIFRKSF